MIRMLSETKFLGSDAVVQKLEDFGFEVSGDGFYDYFIPFTEYCACVNLDDMGAFIEDSQGNYMHLPFMRGQERVRLSGTVVGEFLDFIRDIEREADSVGGDISYMFESKKLRKSSNESNKTFTRRRSNRMNEAQSYSGGFTVQDIANVAFGGTKVEIYNRKSENYIAYQEYLKDVVRDNPEIASCEVLYLSARGNNRLILEVNCDYTEESKNWR